MPERGAGVTEMSQALSLIGALDQHNAMLDDMNKNLDGVKAYITELEESNAALRQALRDIYDNCTEHPECRAAGEALQRRGR